MRTASFRSLLLAAVLPLGLAACGPEIDENILKTCDARAPRGSDAHDQCVSNFESGAEVLPQGNQPWDVAPQGDQPWDVAPQLVIRDPDPNGIVRDVQQQLVIRDPDPNGIIQDQQGTRPWDVAAQVIIRDQDGKPVVIRDQDGKLVPWDVAAQVVIRDGVK